MSNKPSNSNIAYISATTGNINTGNYIPWYNPLANKRDEFKNMLDILHVAFNLSTEEYKTILNLINSNEESNIEIAGAMLRNLHRSYNITKKTDEEINKG